MRLRPGCLVPTLLKGLKHVNVAAAILDLSNFVTRERIGAAASGVSGAQEISLLLAGLVGRLGQIESSPVPRAKNWKRPACR